MTLPRPLQRLIAGRHVRIDGQKLDLKLQVILRLVDLVHPGPAFKQPTVGASRAHTREMAAAMNVPGALERISCEAIDVDGATGPMVRVPSCFASG
jgi:hypothetical protein